MTLLDGVSLAAGVLGCLAGCAALARLFITHGADRQRLSAAETAVAALALKSDAALLTLGSLASRSSVEAVEGRVGGLEQDMREAREALSTIPVMDERLKGFEKLMASQMDELKHGIRGLKTAMESIVSDRRRRSPST